MRKLVKDFLKKKDFEIVEAADGEEALDIFFKDKSISLIICDVMMPCIQIMLLRGVGSKLDEYISKPFESNFKKK